MSATPDFPSVVAENGTLATHAVDGRLAAVLPCRGALYLSGHQWLVAYLLAANQGWLWRKSWRLWIPPRSAAGLQEIDATIKYEMADVRASTGSELILVTDFQFRSPWGDGAWHTDLDALSFAAFSAPSRGTEGWRRGDRLPRGPRWAPGFGAFLCDHDQRLPGLSWFWHREALALMHAVLMESFANSALATERELRRLADYGVSRGQVLQIGQAMHEIASQWCEGAEGLMLFDDLFQKATAWEAQAVQPWRLSEHWVGNS